MCNKYDFVFLASDVSVARPVSIVFACFVVVFGVPRQYFSTWLCELKRQIKSNSICIFIRLFSDFFFQILKPFGFFLDFFQIHLWNIKFYIFPANKIRSVQHKSWKSKKQTASRETNEVYGWKRKSFKWKGARAMNAWNQYLKKKPKKSTSIY